MIGQEQSAQHSDGLQVKMAQEHPARQLALS
jgi:hypothetical protein